MPNLNVAGELELRYRQGALLPSVTIDWYDGPAADAALLALGSGGYTFELKASRGENTAALFTKTTGITGGNVSPSVTIDWTAGDLGTLAAGDYVLTLKATRVSDSKPRFLPVRLRLVVEAVPS